MTLNISSYFIGFVIGIVIGAGVALLVFRRELKKVFPDRAP